MSHYPQQRGFSGVLRPLRLEGDILDLELEGEVPAQLNGCFHRVHPDAQFPPKFDNDQFFNGDGMVSLFRFRNGTIDFKQRYVQTDKWQLERAAGRSLFGAYRNPLTDEDSVKGKIRGTANTNVMVHAGQLYAMKEDSPCFLMDPLTLESKGYTDFDGALDSQTFCAHPKIDPKTGNFCGFAYATKGLLTRDYGVTEDYVVFHDGTRIFFDIPVAGRPYLHRWSVDMASNSDSFAKVEKLSEWIDEFPRIDDRYATFAYRHGWMLVMDPEMPFEGPGGRATRGLQKVMAMSSRGSTT